MDYLQARLFAAIQKAKVYPQKFISYLYAPAISYCHPTMFLRHTLRGDHLTPGKQFEIHGVVNYTSQTKKSTSTYVSK
jgi:hypothetical protein